MNHDHAPADRLNLLKPASRRSRPRGSSPPLTRPPRARPRAPRNPPRERHLVTGESPAGEQRPRRRELRRRTPAPGPGWHGEPHGPRP
ncbi:Os02g0528300 [Oryza sativa Japonica Group]|uniref:Os02g0528300 protein n=1 Tax=Oryza sativa subsp. japonica TaxID=39947 RepID=A0A0P0VJS7_ORYSJ|nr:Os02g0528300 [Oryza sativa Japonica Group]